MKVRPMKPYRLAVFDFDGTLVDSVHAIAHGIQLANQKMGLKPVDYETAKSVIGLGFEDVYPIVAPELKPEQFDEYKKIYVGYFLQSDPLLKLFPGALELVSSLRQADIKTGIATGKSRKGLSRIMNRMDINDYFDYTVPADESRPKPDPLMLRMILEKAGLDPSQAVMIGDTEHDIKLAQNAGMDVIAVSWGAAPRSRLEQYRPTAIADSFKELSVMLGVSI